MALSAFLKSPLFKTTTGLNSERAFVVFSQRLFASKGQEIPSPYLDGDKEETSVALQSQQQKDYLHKLKTTQISVDKPNVLSSVSGVPEEHVANRRVRIYKQAKNAMQSGTYDTKKWKLDYENRERWENPLMGWASSGDPLSNMNLWFTTKEDAIEYCQRHGLYYEVDEPQERRNLKKSYAENFSWSKRTRVGSK